MQNNRMNVKSIIADANLRRDLMVPTIQAIQAREGIETNYEQADRAYCVARIKELEKQITAARNDYYNGVSKITDQHYDALVDELSLLDPKNLAVIGIGAEPVSNWEKFAHQFPMGSLNKSQTQEEFIKWSNDHISKDDEIFLTLKLDGLSISLVYENGILIKAVTRGSGTTGEIITPNVARMQNVPLRLKQKISATIRGEIVLSKDNHQKYFSEYSNTRNAASGISRRYDGQGCEHLSILVYQMYSEDFDLITQKQQFEELSKLGFRVPAFYIAKFNDEVEDIRNLYQTSLRDQYEFDLDGLVAHNNDIAKLESFGSVNNRPKGSIAIKFDSIAKEATIANIIVQTGNSGRITPIAVFSPKVQLMGAEVEKASLHNFSNIADLGIDIGAKVLVCRSNDVIPFVKEVTQSTGTIFQPPVHCSQCGSETIKNGEYLQCSGDRCPAKIIGKLINWISEINVLEWGESLLEKLITSGKVKDIADLYRLSIDDLSSIERMGKKSAKNCYEALHSNKEIPLEIFIGGLSIPLIGQSTIKIIMNAGYKTLDAFFQAKASDFESVIGVGPTKALSLATGLESNKELIQDILANGVSIKEPIVGKLTGKVFAITGSTNIKRSELEKMITNFGGEYKSSINKSCSHLIIADPNSTSTKAVSAKKLGIKLISEDDFISLLQ